MFRTVCLTVIIATALAVPTNLSPVVQTAVAKPNLTEIVRQYMHFGAEDGQFDTYNCTLWSRLFEATGTRNTPGIPPQNGWDALEAICETTRSQFTILFCDVEEEIDNMSYNSEKRTAFKWTINGVLNSTGTQVSVPAITTLFMRKDGSIQTSWDFLDPHPFGMSPLNIQRHSEELEVTAGPNITEIVRVYMNFGGFPNYPAAANCTQWAQLFDANDGIRNTPGVPPVKGFTSLFQKCQDTRGQFQTLLNYASFVIPVISWNAQRRVAFTWGIEGLTVDGRIIQKQAISALFMYQNGTIQTAWDFLDPSGI